MRKKKEARKVAVNEDDVGVALLVMMIVFIATIIGVLLLVGLAMLCIKYPIIAPAVVVAAFAAWKVGKPLLRAAVKEEETCER